MERTRRGGATAPAPALPATAAPTATTISPDALAPGPDGSPAALEAPLPPPPEGLTALETRRMTRDDEPAAPAPKKKAAKRPRRAKKADGGPNTVWKD